MSRPPLYLLWPAVLLGALEAAFWLALLYGLWRVVVKLLALGVVT